MLFVDWIVTAQFHMIMVTKAQYSRRDGCRSGDRTITDGGDGCGEDSVSYCDRESDLSKDDCRSTKVGSSFNTIVDCRRSDASVNIYCDDDNFFLNANNDDDDDCVGLGGQTANFGNWHDCCYYEYL